MYSYLPVLDSYFSIVLFGPLVAAYWRGTWGLADVYIFTDNKLLSFGISMGGGILIYFSFMILQDHFTKLNYKMNSPVFYVCSRLHSYILGHACVNYWRGFMGFMDKSGNTYLSASLMTVLSTILLILFRGSCNAISAPLFTIPDRGSKGRKDYFKITTRFKTKSELSLKFFLDCCFSVVVIIGLVIVQWQGIWGLIDLVIMPQDKVYSAWLSVCIGYTLTVILFVVQWPLMYSVKRIKQKSTQKSHFYLLLLTEGCMNFCGTTASALVWRGLWNLQDELLLVDYKEASLWLSHGVGVVCLMIMFHFNTVIQAGLSTDGDTIFSEGKSFFEIRFITNILEYDTKMELSPCDTNQGLEVHKTNKEQDYSTNTESLPQLVVNISGDNKLETL